MVCPACSLYISDPSAQTCPRCGQSLLNRPDRAPGGEQFPTGSVSPSSQPVQPGFSSPTTSQWMKPSLAPAPAQPVHTRSRRRRNLVSGIVFILIIAACAGWGYLAFIAHGTNAINGITPIPGTNVLFSDPLTSDTKGWSDITSHCFFQANAYHIRSDVYCLAPAGNIADANISVQAKQVAGSLLYPYGIVFRRTSTGNWYEFDIDSNSKWAFFKVVNETESVIVNYTPNAAIKGGLNTVNTLLVQAKGSHFVFSVNGTQVGEADDTTFTSGRIGLSASGADTEVAYTDFEITAAS